MPILLSSAIRRKKFTGPAPAPYSDDVLATLLYTGSGTGVSQNTLATQLSGFDLGGLFWAHYRSGAADNINHHLFNTFTGVTSGLSTNSSAVASGSNIATFNPNGVTIANTANTANVPYVGWFMKVAKSFFTIVSWTGDGQGSRTIPHNLEQLPGLIIVKCLNANTAWTVWHRGATGDLNIGSNVAQAASRQLITAADINGFTLGNSPLVNDATYQFQAMIWAHDISTNGVVVSDAFTCDTSGAANINCGWPIQWAMIKNLSTGSWYMIDAARGPSQILLAESTNAETTLNAISFTSVGFNVTGFGANAKYVFTAIRAPNKPGNPNTVTIAGGTSVDLRAMALSNGWDQTSALTVNVTADIGSASTATPALLIAGEYPLGVTLNVAAGVMIAGRGGLGSNRAIGKVGGPGITITTNNPVYINNQGIIAGGGGGGGGYFNNANFGGNGAGLPIQPGQTGTVAATRTNGANGGNSSYGAGGIGGAAGSPGATAPTNGGSGGGGGLGGAGGASSARGSGYTFSDPASNGQGGAGTTDSDATAYSNPTYAGGAAGPYIIGNSKVNWLTTGTRYGAFVA